MNCKNPPGYSEIRSKKYSVNFFLHPDSLFSYFIASTLFISYFWYDFPQHIVYPFFSFKDAA